MQKCLRHCTTHDQILDLWQQPHPRPFTHRTDCFPAASPASPSPAHVTLRNIPLSLRKPPVPPQVPSLLSDGTANGKFRCETSCPANALCNPGRSSSSLARSLRRRARGLAWGPALSLPPTAPYLLCISATCHCPLPGFLPLPLLTCPPQVAFKPADCARPATPA